MNLQDLKWSMMLIMVLQDTVMSHRAIMLPFDRIVKVPASVPLSCGVPSVPSTRLSASDTIRHVDTTGNIDTTGHAESTGNSDITQMTRHGDVTLNSDTTRHIEGMLILQDTVMSHR